MLFCGLARLVRIGLAIEFFQNLLELRLVLVYTLVHRIISLGRWVLGNLVDVNQVLFDELLETVDVLGPVLRRRSFEVPLHVVDGGFCVLFCCASVIRW